MASPFSAENLIASLRDLREIESAKTPHVLWSFVTTKPLTCAKCGKEIKPESKVNVLYIGTEAQFHHA